MLTLDRRRISVSAEATPEWTIDQDLAFYRRLGLGRARLALHKLRDEDPDGDEIRRVKDSGFLIDVVYRRLGPLLPTGLVGIDLADPASGPRAGDRLATAMEVCRAVGAHDLFVTPGSANGLAWEQALEAFSTMITPAVQAGRDLGVRIVIEPIGPSNAHLGFVHSLRDAVGLSRDLGLGIAFDIAHCWWEPGLYDTLRDNIDLISVVQLSDLRFDDPLRLHRLVPGDGQLPLRRVIDTVTAAGYQGPFELEVLGPELDREGAERTNTRGVEALERLLTQPGS